jgi:hypothetical protein
MTSGFSDSGGDEKQRTCRCGIPRSYRPQRRPHAKNQAYPLFNNHLFAFLLVASMHAAPARAINGSGKQRSFARGIAAQLSLSREDSTSKVKRVRFLPATSLTLLFSISASAHASSSQASASPYADVLAYLQSGRCVVRAEAKKLTSMTFAPIRSAAASSAI